MSMPKIPDINPNINITRDDAVNITISSIAMEELALAHILNAEGEKLQYVLGTLEESKPGDDITICDVMAVNKSIQKTLKEVIKAEMILELKLEDAIELSEGQDSNQFTIKGQTIWRDGNNYYKTRPANVDITLQRDGVDYRTATVSSTGSGAFTFPCLPICKNSGEEYTYTIDEKHVPTGYTKEVSGFTVTNTAKEGNITVTGTKTWVDDNDKGNKRPPHITVNLLENDTEVDSKDVPKNATQFSFADLPQFDEDGNALIYTVKEVPVGGYKTEINGYHITNTLIP